MKRREFFLTGAAVALPASPHLPPKADTTADRRYLLQIIEQLETHQGWEAASVIAAKHFAAWQFRKALSLSLADREYPQMHIDFQRGSFEQYQSTARAEQDREHGTAYQIAPMERELV